MTDAELVGRPRGERELHPGELNSAPQREPPDLPDPGEPGETLPPAREFDRDPDKVMSLVDHLTELRRRLVVSAAAVLAGSVAGFYFAAPAIELLARPILRGRPLVFLDVGGAFFLQLKIAVMIGLALAVPVVLYQVWAFVSPGLTPQERRLARPWIPFAILFFALGVGVAYALGMSQGGAVVLGTLAASASYIAAPAAVQLALPEANPSYYLTCSLAITFPFNIVVGLPLYQAMAQALYG